MLTWTVQIQCYNNPTSPQSHSKDLNMPSNQSYNCRIVISFCNHGIHYVPQELNCLGTKEESDILSYIFL